jgi:hypothetical protein
VPIGAHIQVEGLKELQAGLRDAQNKLPKALGESHKRVGRFIISKLPEGSPNAVGAGTGSQWRASATKRDVILRVGYGARPTLGDTGHAAQWGKKMVQPFEPGRPYMVGAIEEHMDEIEDMFTEEMLKVVGPAFYSAKFR